MSLQTLTRPLKASYHLLTHDTLPKDVASVHPEPSCVQLRLTVAIVKQWKLIFEDERNRGQLRAKKAGSLFSP